MGFAPGLEATELREFSKERWNAIVRTLLAGAGKDAHDVADDSADVPWKIAIAARLRQDGVPCRYIRSVL